MKYITVEKGKMKEITMGEFANMGGASRLSGKAALREAIERLRQKADQYETLLNELPDDLSESADQGLWLLAIGVQR